MDPSKHRGQHMSFLVIVLRAVFRHKRLFYSVFGGTILLVVAVTFLMHKQYKSEMKYIVQSARSNAVVSPDHASNSYVSIVTEDQLNTELDIIQSEDVLSAVADPGWDPAKALDKSTDEQKAHAKKMANFTSHLTVDPVHKANVLTISYLGRSPREAFDTLQLLSTTYLARHERLQRPPATTAFYEEEARRYNLEWKNAVQDLVDFQQQNQLVTVPDIEQSLQRAITQDEEALRLQRLRLTENSHRLSETAHVLSDVAQRQTTQQRVVPSELLLQQLKLTLLTLGNRRTELLTRYKPTDRLVTEVDQQIKDSQLALDNAVSQKSEENTTDVNPAWQQLKTSMADGQINQRSLQAGQSELRSQIATLHAQLTSVQGLSLRFEQLRSRSEEAQANYEAFAEKNDREKVEDELDAQKILNVAVLQTPTLPYAPARPNPLLNLALGLLTALFASGTAVYLAESSSTTVGLPSELDAVSDLPILAVIPFHVRKAV